jgi:hypothetical protein
MEGEGVQKGENDTRKRDANNIEGVIPPEPQKEAPKTIEDAIRAGDWIAVARIRAAQIAQLERASHEDADGDGRIGDKKVSASEDAALRDGNGYLDAEGRDPYGLKYYGNFGYDKQGNYHDSYGNTINTKTGVVTYEDNSKNDLRRGVYENEDGWINKVTGEKLVEVNGEYHLMRMGDDGHNETLRILKTKMEAEQLVEEWKRKNPPQSEKQYLEDSESTDRKREQAATGGQTSARNPDLPDPNRRPPDETAAPPPAPSKVQSEKAEYDYQIATAREEALLQQRQASAKRARAIQEITVGKARGQSSLYVNGPDSRAQGVFIVKGGGEVDAKGGFTDKDGGYTEKLGGYRAPDGSYTDGYGSYVDVKGNLWLANDKSDKPSFMKQDGVDYREVLQLWRENNGRLPDEWKKAHPDFKGEKLSTLEAGLKSVDADVAKRGDANTVGNRAYAGQKSMVGNIVDKEGNLWLNGSVTPIAKRDGVDYIDLLKKAEQGKIDDWKKTGDLSPDEVNALKEKVNVIRESGLSEVGLEKQINEMTEIANAAKNGERYETKRENSSKSKFAPKEKTAAAETDDGEPIVKPAKINSSSGSVPGRAAVATSSFVAEGIGAPPPSPTLKEKTPSVSPKSQQPKTKAAAQPT